MAALLVFAAPAMGSKRVVIDKSSQTLNAYEDGALVFRTQVSTGKRGKETPSGRFRAGYKERMRYSSRYHNAPMPYSVNIGGHYFIHGFSSVPSYPASRGCVRLPLGGAAQWFFRWVEPGTPVRIVGHWGSRSRPQPVAVRGRR